MLKKIDINFEADLCFLILRCVLHFHIFLIGLIKGDTHMMT